MPRERVLGNVYGRWTVIDDKLKYNGPNRKVLCRCKDGVEKMVYLND